MSLSITFNESQMAGVRNLLKEVPKLADRVMRASLNKTLTGTRTDVSTGVRSIITASKSKVDASIHKVNATAATIPIAGKVYIKGKALQFEDFKPSAVLAGVSVKIYKAKPRKLYPGAFQATVKAGVKLDGTWGGVTHLGVFKRLYKGAHAGRPVKKPWPKFDKKFRFPMKAMFGPHVATVFEESKPVQAEVMAQAGVRLDTNLTQYLNYEMSKL